MCYSALKDKLIHVHTNNIKGEITPIQQQLIFFIKKNIFLRVNLRSYLKVLSE